MTTMYTNYQTNFPAVQSQPSVATDSKYNDDSIYSTTPFGGASVFSPSRTAMEQATPRDNNVRFEFPPELTSVSSSDSYSSDEKQIVPYVAQRTSPSKSTLELSSPRSTNSLSTAASRIRVPRSNNPHGADSVHPKKKLMKKQRKRRTAAGSVGGMVVGGLVLGPVGVVAGAAAGGAVANRICKARERKAQRKYEQRNFQEAATRSIVHHGAFA